MRIRQIEILTDRAEGDCNGLPYNTELASRDGVAIHFWVGDTKDEERLQKALRMACGHRDVVYATWSYGKPTSYWAHQDIT